MKRVSFVVIVAFALTTLSHAGSIVFSNDEWIWSDNAIAVGNDSQFATNVATWLTGGSGNILLLSNNFGLTGTMFNAQLTGLGYSVTVTTTIPNSLVGWSAVYVGGYAVPAALLTSYVTAGGNVFVEAGTGTLGGAAGEAAQWNPFLNNFGLGLATVYNGYCTSVGGMSGFQTQSPYGPALFNGVSSLFICNGNDVMPFGNNANAQIWYDANGGGLYGAWRGSPSTPEPSSLLLLGTGIAATFTGWRRRWRSRY